MDTFRSDVANLLKESASTELTEVCDIVEELAMRGIITSKDLWLDKLRDDNHSYWLARKTVKYLKSVNL